MSFLRPEKCILHFSIWWTLFKPSPQTQSITSSLVPAKWCSLLNLAVGDSSGVSPHASHMAGSEKGWRSKPSQSKTMWGSSNTLVEMQGNNLFPPKLLKDENMGLDLLTVVLSPMEKFDWVRPTQEKKPRGRVSHIFIVKYPWSLPF